MINKKQEILIKRLFRDSEKLRDLDLKNLPPNDYLEIEMDLKVVVENATWMIDKVQRIAYEKANSN